ncbi:MAG: oligosaccharide flippase family protein [Calothrix sp. SM1_7_51]|nr:oligosaccharide flippase family protein [Calothrix sp. SM1_7_51]
MTEFIQKLRSLSPLKLNTLANYAGKFWSNLLSLVLVPVYLRYLGVEAYGLIGAFYAVTSFIGLLDLGLGVTISREVAVRQAVPEKQATIPDLLRTTEIIYWSVSIVIVLMMAFLAEPIATGWINFENLDLNTVKHTVTILGLTVAIRWAITPYRGTLMALEKQVQVNILEGALRTFKEFGALAVLLKISSTIIAFLLWQTLIAVFEVLFMMLLAWYCLPKSGIRATFKLDILQQIWRFAAGVSWTMVVSLMLSQADKILLSKLVTLKEFGYYMLASSLAQKIIIVIEPLIMAMAPSLTAMIAAGQEKYYSNFFHKSSLLISLALTPVAAALIFFAPTILELWTQSSEVALYTSTILVVLTFGAMLDSMSNIVNQIQLAIGKPQIAAIYNTISLAILIPTMLLVVPRFNLTGAAVIRTILNISYYLVLSKITLAYIMPKEYLRWIVQDTLIPILLCFAIFFIFSQVKLSFVTKQFEIIYIIAPLITSYTLLGCWYKYQRI